jgi:peptide methionine sulfoxide reductase MsrA
VISGYAGGTAADATYDRVGSGRTKHREAVEVVYDQKIVSYTELLQIFFMQIDPTQVDGQFADI